MRYLAILISFLIISAFGVYLLPPYAVQSVVFFTINKSELDEMDMAFAASDERKWRSSVSGLKSIFKTKRDSRLYSIGMETRFERTYEIAFIKSSIDYQYCSPSLLYSDEVFIKCSISLQDGWILSYEGLIHSRIDELLEKKT